MPFAPVQLLDDHATESASNHRLLPTPGWVAVNEHPCTFRTEHFLDVSLNLIRNPNINSSHLFRADIFYDSSGELANATPSTSSLEELRRVSLENCGDLEGFRIYRRIIRQLIPRNPQLDQPVAQTCLILEPNPQNSPQEWILLQIPHVTKAEGLPWYHPAVKAVAYWYTAPPSRCATDSPTSGSPDENVGKIAVHYQLFPDQVLPLSIRLIRISQRLLQVLHKHGQGQLNGYTKKGQHDQIISQKRVQDTYTALKAQHAKRLTTAWVEQTEPSKHVFEDLGIAAFLIELWKDMYAPPEAKPSTDASALPPFPGFVDIGCGNGVLTEVLLLAGYHGQGFDARRRKTWAILSPQTQANLHEQLCVPQPLFDLYPAATAETSRPTAMATATAGPPALPPSKPSFFARARAFVHGTARPNTLSTAPLSSTPQHTSTLRPPQHPWHNGLFPAGTFIIANHADELTPWTPLLASLTCSPFLAIPCCSHNLSGARFRAPSACNAHTADDAAPGFFAAAKAAPRAKSVAITIPTHLDDDDDNDDDGNHDENKNRDITLQPETSTSVMKRPETGDLRALAPAARAQQPSAYAALCAWTVHLAGAAGYEVERDQLRIPSTRNIGLVGRRWAGEEVEAISTAVGDEEKGSRSSSMSSMRLISALQRGTHPHDDDAARRIRVQQIVAAEGGADGQAWVKRCEEVLARGGGVVHGRE